MKGSSREAFPEGDRNYGVVSSTIDERGISLTGTWYPQPEGLARWKGHGSAPGGIRGDIGGRDHRKGKRTAAGPLFTFDFPHPVDGLSLSPRTAMRSPGSAMARSSSSRTFFKEDRELARTYLQYAKNYLEQYEKLPRSLSL